nr:hypothetical protein Itr_chr02CG25310 [Ipomoea trifida]
MVACSATTTIRQLDWRRVPLSQPSSPPLSIEIIAAAYSAPACPEFAAFFKHCKPFSGSLPPNTHNLQELEIMVAIGAITTMRRPIHRRRVPLSQPSSLPLSIEIIAAAYSAPPCPAFAASFNHCKPFSGSEPPM